MRRFAYTAAATVALLMGVAAGWTWQQWQPASGQPVASIETTISAGSSESG